MNLVTALMKNCEQIVKKIEDTPHYPVQLNYMDGVFTALWEQNFNRAIVFDADSAEAALTGLNEALLELKRNKNETKSK